MDASVAAAVVATVGGAATVVSTAVTVIGNKKAKADRDADRIEKRALAAKIHAEKGDIVDETRSRLLTDIDMQLQKAHATAERYRAEAERYRNEAERYRDEAHRLRDELAEERARSAKIVHRLTIRSERLTRRAETLEEWIICNAKRFSELQIEGLPIDLLNDRKRFAEEDKNPEGDP
jgi:predicted RNase H-like nuclease (RuvC/YqgF family)